MPLIYAFDHKHRRPPRRFKKLLGGKGANLAEMSTVLDLPVPPGFTITTTACVTYLESGWLDGLDDEIDKHVRKLEKTMGRRIGDADDPLLVSVRSGAAVSMPGMMDTVLNLGLNDASVEGLAAQSGDERFAYDSYRRFIAMYARIVLGIEADPDPFEAILDKARTRAGVETDAEIPASELRKVCRDSKKLVEKRTGKPFPQDPRTQLTRAIDAVFTSWETPRARAYREREHIPHDLGTAVNVQSMVFGNLGDTSGTGVGFTCDPATGEQGEYGDFLQNAQGEDVVAGIRKTLPLSAMKDTFPEPYAQLMTIFERLELHYRDMLDTEFTIERGTLWMLQTRVGKRTGAAALKMAVNMVDDPTIGLTREEALGRITEGHLEQVLHPTMERGSARVLTTGLAASPGAAVGKAYFTADGAADAFERGEKVILVRQETSPEDIHGMAIAEGVLTSRGGLVSHAAVVARGWGKPAVCGADEVKIEGRAFTCNGVTISEGDVLALDGTTGEVIQGDVTLHIGETTDDFDTILGWADEIRRGHLAVRANADNGPDAAKAREFGVEGIGLCRTEHMFLADDRLPIVREMILASTAKEEAAALEKLRVAQKADFEEILEAMDRLPVTIRLLDPPLHEFLPSVQELTHKKDTKGLTKKEQKLLEAAKSWQEFNPMLGTRGVRLGVVKPGLYAMQVRALMEAVLARAEAGGKPIVEIMIPLTVSRAELALARSWVAEAIATATKGSRRKLAVTIGTMIETPRAALRAAEIAEVSDFFSFGTNDLTQMTFAFSRDDVEGRMMGTYLDNGLIPNNPFETIDADGVGELVRLGAQRGRSTNPELKLGVCGEHGGDPASIALFYDAELDYVSCSPYRVPIARLAAAQAVLAGSAERRSSGGDRRSAAARKRSGSKGRRSGASKRSSSKNR